MILFKYFMNSKEPSSIRGQLLIPVKVAFKPASGFYKPADVCPASKRQLAVCSNIRKKELCIPPRQLFCRKQL